MVAGQVSLWQIEVASLGVGLLAATGAHLGSSRCSGSPPSRGTPCFPGRTPWKRSSSHLGTLGPWPSGVRGSSAAA
ncbi:unnamed protein product [Musa acuminata var. zebrina]